MKNAKIEYYLPIKSVNLAHYFRRACLCPVKYIKNRNEDIQSQFKNYLLLSNQRFIRDNNCSLLIVLEPDEADDAIEIHKNFFCFRKPLPISRVKKVIFRDEEQKNNTIFNITSGAAFIPESLIGDIDSATEIFLDEPVKNPYELDENDQDWSKEIEKFDRILGGLAIIAISGDDHQNVPEIYFDTLSWFNAEIKNKLKHQGININNKYNKIFGDIRDANEFIKSIYAKVQNNDVMRSNNDVKLDMRNGLYVLDNIKNKEAYYLAILATYGEGNSKSLDDFISNLASHQFPSKRKEYIALITGINKGYSEFRNSYRIQNTNIDIKFKLDSKLDYYSIESIYQYVFNGKTDNTKYDYLDNWCPSYPVNHEHTSFMQYRTYKVLDREFNGEPFSFIELLQNAKTYIKNNVITRFIEEIDQVFQIIINTQEKNSSALKASSLAKNEKLTALQQQHEELQREFQAVQADKSVVEKKAGELENANRAKDEELTTLTQRQAGLQREFQAVQADKSAVEKKAGELENANRARDEELTTLTQRQEDLQRDYEVAQADKSAVDKKAGELENANQAKDEELTTLTQRQEDLQRNYEAVQADKLVVEKKAAELNVENQAKDGDLTTLQLQLESMERESKTVQTEKAATEQKAEELKAENQVKDEKLTMLQQQHEDLQSDYQVVQAEKSDIEMKFGEQNASIQSKETAEQTDDMSTVVNNDDVSDLFPSDDLNDKESRREALTRYKKVELLKLAKEQGMKKISRFNKKDLVNAILEIGIIK